jgi:hypothetical protein
MQIMIFLREPSCVLCAPLWLDFFTTQDHQGYTKLNKEQA